MKGAKAMTITPMIVAVQKAKVYPKRLRTLGTSRKKLLNSTSFAVAPQDMLISNIWHKMAWDMWMEMPPKKTDIMRNHLKFSKTARFVSIVVRDCPLSEQGTRGAYRKT